MTSEELTVAIFQAASTALLRIGKVYEEQG